MKKIDALIVTEEGVRKDVISPCECGSLMVTSDGVCQVCTTKETHNPECKFLRAITCPVGIECEHGYDVCPSCDPCTCKGT